ncbi:MAG: sulfite exporter TauE/SafE family protein [Myxococcota bacterium]|nr:sulfite exporter TauE/SafE family protein [Myxococcota bacterium]
MGCGVVAGFVNTLAGGGSFLAVPLLTLLGLPVTVANATNRVAVLAQNLTAVAVFRREGVSGLDLGLRLLPATLLGSWLGSWVASWISPEIFEPLFGLVMLAALPLVLRKPALDRSAPRRLSLPLQVAIYFGLGVYGGAIQAGIGIPLLLALVGAGGLDLVRANSVKVVIIAALTAVALVQFVVAGLVVWSYGLVLAAGSAIGGYLAARWGSRIGPGLIRPVLLVAIVALAIRFLV